MGKLPDFADWRRPWKDGELDEEAAAKLVYNARKSEQEAKEKLSTKESELSALQTQLDDATTGKAGLDADGQAELIQLRKENRELKSSTGKPRPEDQKRIDQYEVALELGLSAKAAKRLVGETREEIEADAKEYLSEIGQDPGDGDNEGDEGEQQFQLPSRVPVSSLKTGNPPANGAIVNGPSNPAAAVSSLPPLSY